jgi:hypothetical protein
MAIVISACRSGSLMMFAAIHRALFWRDLSDNSENH